MRLKLFGLYQSLSTIYRTQFTYISNNAKRNKSSIVVITSPSYFPGEPYDLSRFLCLFPQIGQRYVPEVEVSDLSNIILETIASLNEINPLTTRLIQIARDGKISDDEIKDFAVISKKLDEISLAIDSLNLWVDKTASEQGLNIKLLNKEKEKLK